jgi:hypothetical protein
MGTYVQLPSDGPGKKVATRLDAFGNHVGVYTPLLAATSTSSSVAANVASVQLLAANAARLSVRVFNNSVEVLRIKEGTTPGYRLRLQDRPGTAQARPLPGILHGIWDAADGSGTANTRAFLTQGPFHPRPPGRPRMGSGSRPFKRGSAGNASHMAS